MNVLNKTVEAGKDTQKTFFWVLGSTVVGIIVAFLADPEVLEVVKTNPKIAIWIPVINVVMVFAKQLFRK